MPKFNQGDVVAPSTGYFAPDDDKRPVQNDEVTVTVAGEEVVNTIHFDALDRLWNHTWKPEELTFVR